MEIIKTEIPGCFEIILDELKDERGNFVKIYHNELFIKHGLTSEWKEEYFTTSKKDVVRGMHFQHSKYSHEKIVYCTKGSILDVVVDLRLDSPSYKKCVSFNLLASKPKLIYIPKGCGHGFLSLQDNSSMFYKVSSIYNANYDSGILWNSIGFEWPILNPILSLRDKSHPSLDNFKSEFFLL